MITRSFVTVVLAFLTLTCFVASAEEQSEVGECKVVTSASWFISDKVCPEGHKTLPKSSCGPISPPFESIPCCESHTLDCPMEQ